MSLTADYRSFRQATGSVIGLLFFVALIAIAVIVINPESGSIAPKAVVASLGALGAAYFSYQLLTCLNSRVIVEGDRIADYDALGRLVLEQSLHDIRDVRSLGGSVGYSNYVVVFTDGSSLHVSGSMRNQGELLALVRYHAREKL